MARVTSLKAYEEQEKQRALVKKDEILLLEIMVTDKCPNCSESWFPDFLLESEIMDISHTLKNNPSMAKVLYGLYMIMAEAPMSSVIYQIPLQYLPFYKSYPKPLRRYIYYPHPFCDCQVMVTFNRKTQYYPTRLKSHATMFMYIERLSDHTFSEKRCLDNLDYLCVERAREKALFSTIEVIDESPVCETTSLLITTYTIRDEDSGIIKALNLDFYAVYSSLIDKLENQCLQIVGKTALSDIILYENGNSLSLMTYGFTKYIAISCSHGGKRVRMPFKVDGSFTERIKNGLMVEVTFSCHPCAEISSPIFQNYSESFFV